MITPFLAHETMGTLIIACYGAIVATFALICHWIPLWKNRPHLTASIVHPSSTFDNSSLLKIINKGGMNISIASISGMDLGKITHEIRDYHPENLVISAYDSFTLELGLHAPENLHTIIIKDSCDDAWQGYVLHNGKNFRLYRSKFIQFVQKIWPRKLFPVSTVHKSNDGGR